MIKEIRANVRTSFKIPTSQGDVFYTFEYGETRADNFEAEEAYNQEKQMLWTQCNNEVFKQIASTYQQYGVNVNDGRNS